MRFISVFTHEATNQQPPDQEEIAVMGKLIEEGMKAGWLIATEGVSFSEVGVKVHKGDGGESPSSTGRSPRRRRSSVATRCSRPARRPRSSSSPAAS